MKKLISSICLLLCTINCLADDEKVCAIGTTGTGSNFEACTPSALGFVDPCSSQLYQIKFKIPPGFNSVAQFEWFVNDISVKVTTNPSDQYLTWQNKSINTVVRCNVIYQTQGGTISQVFPSTSFTPDVKQLNFGEIVATSPSPQYGCTSNNVSYSLNTYTCTGNFCSTTYNVGQYSITWQAPSGWTQTNISTNGNNVTFSPNATSSGALTATITLPCGFTDKRTITIIREVVKPSFTSFTNPICSSTSGFEINPICGAVSYTYTIAGSSGITFTANGLQSLTTSILTPSLSLSGNPAFFTLKAKANYAGNVASEEESVNLAYGSPKLLYVSSLEAFSLIGQRFDYSVNGPGNSFSICPSEYLTFSPFVPSGVSQGVVTGHEWQVSGSTSFVGATNQFNLNVIAPSSHPGSFQFTYRYQNQCGWSPLHYGLAATRDCDGSEEPFRVGATDFDFSISPNPAMNFAVLQTKGINSAFEIKIFDLMTSKLEGYLRFEQVEKQVQLNLANLKAGTYVVQVTSKGVTKSKQLKVLH